jgi:hypothetical protein
MRRARSFPNTSAHEAERDDSIARRSLADLASEPVTIPDSDRIVHLQFRRFAGCPVCNLHLQSFVRRHAEIAAAGVREVIVFHSTTEKRSTL